jgi:hypothetical protein
VPGLLSAVTVCHSFRVAELRFNLLPRFIDNRSQTRVSQLRYSGCISALIVYCPARLLPLPLQLEEVSRRIARQFTSQRAQRSTRVGISSMETDLLSCPTLPFISSHSSSYPALTAPPLPSTGTHSLHGNQDQSTRNMCRIRISVLSHRTIIVQIRTYGSRSHRAQDARDESHSSFHGCSGCEVPLWAMAH